MRRLLILSCSERKNQDHNELTAIERYDGPAFRVLRRYMHLNNSEDLDVMILSAEFGLITSDTTIPCYNRRLTLDRASELLIPVNNTLSEIIQSNIYNEIFLSAGKMYLQLLTPSVETTQGNCEIIHAKGGIGEKLTQLYSWLYGR